MSPAGSSLVMLMPMISLSGTALGGTEKVTFSRMYVPPSTGVKTL